jgi:hypothetical protein
VIEPLSLSKAADAINDAASGALFACRSWCSIGLPASKAVCPSRSQLPRANAPADPEPVPGFEEAEVRPPRHVFWGRHATGVLFSLLGPLQIFDEDREIPLGAPKHRALLALLLLRHGESVAVESLAEQLWAGEPPATATKAVRVYVGELRKALGADVIVTRGGGYPVARLVKLLKL